MDTFSHRSYDRRKLLKVLLLRGQERRPVEEGNYVRQKILTPSDDVDQSTVLSSIGLDVAASSEPLADQPEHLAPVSVLADVELWNKLKAATARWITVDGDCKAALAIYVARDVAIQPFLLIVRTRHIVTVALAPDGTVTTSSAGFSGFPAYSRIYRQQRLQFCYHRPSNGVAWARSFLPGSACRHAARTISSRRHHSPCSAYSL